MKIMKKVAALMLAVFLAVPCFSMAVSAAEGRVSFTDPETKTGESVEVACALRSGEGSLDTFDITLKYDPEFLSFESGEDGVKKESDGVVKFSGKGNGSNKIRFTMKFQALKVGTTKIEVTDSEGTLTDGDSVECVNGNSTIQIAEGTEPAVTTTETTETSETEETSNTIKVCGKEYSFSEEFASSEIPVGFAESTIIYDGGERKIVQSESGTIKLGYLVDAEGKGDFFLYNEENATFSPYVQVTVSPTASIILLDADKGLSIPKGYQEVKLTVDEYEFPAWQDKEHEGFYLVYAMSANGQKGLYQYDNTEGSYQRFIAKDAETSSKSVIKVGKIAAFIDEHLSIIIVCSVFTLLLLMVLIIVLAVKLHHRNLELDDLYEEFDIGYEDDDDDVLRIEDDETDARDTYMTESNEEDYLDDDMEFEDDIDDNFEDDFDDNEFLNEEVEETVEYLDEDDDESEEDLDDDFDFDVDDFEIDFIDLDE